MWEGDHIFVEPSLTMCVIEKAVQLLKVGGTE